MTRADMEKLGTLLTGGGIRPVQRERQAPVAPEVFGFDTEYDSATGKLLSYQLWHPESGGRFVEARKLSVKSLSLACEQMIRRASPRIVLLTWYSLAEIQHLDLTSCIKLKVYARGSLDVTWETKHGTVEVYDLARWYDGAALSRAAESLGEKKLPWAREKISRGDLRKRGFREYAVNDARLCRVLYDSLAAEFGKEGIDILEVKTPASASARLFRKRYVEEEIAPPPAEVRRLAARCTWGGRAEAFARGSWPNVAEWDLKSAYPSAAVAIGIFPAGDSWEGTQDVEDVSDAKGFARVRFKFPSETFAPCLPVEADDRNLWPIEGESWASGFEIAAAIDMGADLTMVEGYFYNDGTTVLSEYMKHCMGEREKSKAAARQKWKLCANALVGKFAQRTPRTADDLAVAEAAEIETKVFFSFSPEERVEIARLIGWNLGINTGPVWYPEWQGLITGYVRAQIARAIDPSTVYCHTDSIWAKGKIQFQPDSGWEKKDSGSCIVARTRFGRLGDHTAHHAVHSRKVAEEMLSRFAATGQDVEVDYVRKGSLKFRAALRAGRIADVGRWESRDMAADTCWDGKRILLPDGTTRPWANLADYFRKG